MVFDRDGESEEGLAINHVFQQLPGLSPQQIKKAVEWLSDEGHLYSTVDEDHYKCKCTVVGL